MTLEEYFVQQLEKTTKLKDELEQRIYKTLVDEYEKVKNENMEYEKKLELFKIELREAQERLEEVRALIAETAKFIQSADPYVTEAGALYLSFFLYDGVATEAIELLKKIGVNIKEQKE